MGSLYHIIRLLFYLSAATILLLVGTSCSVSKTLAPETHLYTGADYTFSGDSSKTYSSRFLSGQMERVQLQKPNRKVFGLPVRLWLYNLFATPKEQGLWYNLQQRLGQPPVILDSLSAVRSAERMEQQLFNLGHFRARVQPDIQRKKHKASVQYQVHLQPAYRIDTISYALPLHVLEEIATEKDRTRKIGPGKPYQLSALREELERIETRMQDQGYFFFQSKYLRWAADTLSRPQPQRVWLQLKTAPDVPERALSVQRIGGIQVFSDVQPGSRQTLDTFQYADIRFVAEEMKIDPDVIYNNTLLRLLDSYSPGRQQNTLERLSRISYYRFVNLRFTEITELDSLLEMDIYLTSREQHRLEGSVGLSYKPATYWGPEFSVTYINRNFLGGAEELRVTGSGLFNIPLANAPINQDFQQTDFEMVLTAPSLQIPFAQNRKRARLRQAFTRHRIAYERERLNVPLRSAVDIIDDLQLSDLQDALARDSSATSGIRFNLLGGSIEYLWQRQPTILNQLRPLSVTYQDIRFRNDEFARLLDEVFSEVEKSDFLLQFQDILSVQPSFTFRFDTRTLDRGNHDFFYEGTVGLGSSWLFPKDVEFRPTTNQFIRLENDLRHYWQIRAQQTLATRISLHGIRSRRNNIAVPILDFYRIGGPNSLRGFRPRGLGPGTLDPTDLQTLGLLAGQGELRLESTLEYRWKVTSLVELAAFADAGNVWLVTDLISSPDTRFDAADFLQEIALNAGIGLRLDLGYLLLRLDLAAPLTKPWLPAGERWVGNMIRPGLPAWRQENLIFNLAFGYPF